MLHLTWFVGDTTDTSLRAGAAAEWAALRKLKRPKKNVVFPVTLSTPIFGPYPKVFIKIYLFFIKSYIMLFV